MLLQIILAIVAWKRGWKAWALMPLAVTVVLGFAIGVVAGVQGDSFEDVMPLALVLDGACIMTLIVLIARPRKVSVNDHKKAEHTVTYVGVPIEEPILDKKAIVD